MSTELHLADDWVSSACTLPTNEQPLRVAEFDDLFRQGVTGTSHSDGTPVLLTLRPDPDTIATAARLAARETSCCSFFTFDLAIRDGQAAMSISADPPHAAVLDALARRASVLSQATR